MYEELVKRLRLAEAVLSRNKDLIALLSDAADAIECLSRERKTGKWMESQDAAKWALKATPGMKLNVSKDITLEATKDITQEEAMKWLNI